MVQLSDDDLYEYDQEIELNSANDQNADLKVKRHNVGGTHTAKIGNKSPNRFMRPDHFITGGVTP